MGGGGSEGVETRGDWRGNCGLFDSTSKAHNMNLDSLAQHSRYSFSHNKLWTMMSCSELKMSKKETIDVTVDDTLAGRLMCVESRSDVCYICLFIYIFIYVGWIYWEALCWENDGRG